MGKLLAVDQLPHDCTEQELTALVRPFGHVVSVRLVRDSLNNFLDFGLVEMERPEEALSAMKGLNGSELRGHCLVVSLLRDPDPKRR
jgi:RNA recognition motif-containing protein